MKHKKSTNEYANTNKSNYHHAKSTSPIQKEFELIYRTCDTLGTNQQIESLFLLKQKKISQVDQPSSQQAKSKKKKQPAKKKKSEEKMMVDEVCRLPHKSKDAMMMTKSTMPSSTIGTFGKSIFGDSFNEKIDLNKSAIRKINNLNNSNSSRYLESKNLNAEKSPAKKSLNRKAIPKSPSKPNLSSHKQLQSSQKYVESSTKSIERGLRAVDKVKCIKTKKEHKSVAEEESHEYIFLDDEYIKVDKPSSQEIVEKLYLASKLNEEKSKNEFIEEFKNYRSELEEEVESEDEEEEENEEDVEQYIFSKIVLIQKWWRDMLKKSMKKEVKNFDIKKMEFIKSTSGHQSNSSRKSQREEQLNNSAIEKEESKNFIDMRESLITNELQSQKSLLLRMLEMNKIDTLTYSQSLMKIETSYTKKMNKIMKLKEKIELETQKTEELKNKIKEKTDIIDDLHNIPASIILDKFFNDDSQSDDSENDEKVNESNNISNRQKSTGCHYSTLTPEKEKEKVVSYKKNDIQNSEITSPLHIARENFEHEEDEEEPSCENSYEQGSGIREQMEGEFFELYSDRQIAQCEIEKRSSIQLGMAYPFNEKPTGITTSVVSIHNFLTSFLKFYEYFYKDEFLKLINLPYGYNQLTRLKVLQGYHSESWVKSEDSSSNDEIFMDYEHIIGQEILEDFQEHSYQLPEETDDDTKEAIEFDKIHQKAIVDCFNESLNCFRPYYFINGAPYSWNHSEKALTFYFIAEENIQEVFEKTQYKVLKSASSLCGTIVDSLIMKPAIEEDMSLQEKLVKYRESVNIVLVESREEKLGKIEKQEIGENNYKWESCEEDKTKIMLDVGNYIFESLILEMLNIKPYGNEIENFDEGTMKEQMPLTESSVKESPSSNENEQEDQSEDLSSEKGHENSQASNEESENSSMEENQSEERNPSEEEALEIIEFEDSEEGKSNSDFEYEES